MQIEPRDIALADLKEFVDRTSARWRSRKPRFSVDLDGSLPTHVRTDPQRLQQVLKNLLANPSSSPTRAAYSCACHTVQDRAAGQQALPAPGG